MTAPRNVMHVLGGAGVGGTETQLLLVLAALDPARYRSELILIRGGPLEGSFRALVPTTVIEKRGKVDPLFLLRLTRAIARANPDIVHTWGSTPNLWGSIAARLSRAPHLIVTDRALEEWKGRVLRAGDRLVGSWADRVVGNSAAVVAASIERGAPPDRTAVVNNGVRLPAVYDGSRREPGLVVLVGRFDPRKGHDVLVEALPALLDRHPATRVVIAGPAVRAEEIALRDRVQRRIAELRVGDSVTLLDRVDGPGELLDRASVAVAPSRSEGMPNFVLEAMAHGTPLVATVVGGVPDVVTDGVTGWLVPSEDSPALAAALAEALGDPDEAAIRAAAARKHVEDHFSPAAAAEAWMKLYDEVAGDSEVHRRPS